MHQRSSNKPLIYFCCSRSRSRTCSYITQIIFTCQFLRFPFVFFLQMFSFFRGVIQIYSHTHRHGASRLGFFFEIRSDSAPHARDEPAFCTEMGRA